MHYEDVHDHAAPHYYIVPNEDTLAWRGLVKGLRVNRAAAICSSGEVGLVALLPTVRKELVLIDHSYASLAVAMLKFTMLRELGAAETRRLLTDASVDDITKNLDNFLATLPEKVRNAYQNVVTKDDWEGGFIQPDHRKHDFNQIDPATGYYKLVEENQGVNKKLKREWERLPQRDLYRCASKLTKVKFVHGDLYDLNDRGPFDLLYISNAFDHLNRDKVKPNFKELEKCLSPGAYVIGTSNTRAMSEAGWEQVAVAKNTVSSIIWRHVLYRVPVKEEVAA